MSFDGSDGVQLPMSGNATRIHSEVTPDRIASPVDGCRSFCYTVQRSLLNFTSGRIVPAVLIGQPVFCHPQYCALFALICGGIAKTNRLLP